MTLPCFHDVHEAARLLLAASNDELRKLGRCGEGLPQINARLWELAVKHPERVIRAFQENE